MYVCLDCNATFLEPKHWEECHGFDHGPFEQICGCPYCGGAYTEAQKCDECGEWITSSYIKLHSGERFCEECYTVYELGEE